jgi:hypothetical protein
MNPNPEQIKSAIRWVVTTFGALAAGWFAHSGFITADQVLGILNSQAFMSIAVSVVSGIVGLVVHKQSNAIAVVKEIAKDPTSPVAGIVTTDSVAGRDLAHSMNDLSVVAPAGTTSASVIAKS